MTYFNLLKQIVELGFPRNLVLDHDTFASVLEGVIVSNVHGDDNEVWFVTFGTRVSTYRSGSLPSKNKDES
jgi:hypothetical protein